MLNKFPLIFLTLLFIVPAANAIEPINVNIPDAKQVGEGRMSYLFWDIYDAALFAPKGEWQKNAPFALSLTYLRELNGKAIADRSAEEIRDLGFKDEVILATWHSQMRNIFPDVKEGTTLIGVYTREKESVFFKDNVEIGRISDPDFGTYFFNIWLDPKTTEPELRAKLLGKR
jgi:hypothetical protein